MQIVTDENDLMVINRSGLTIRVAVSDIRVTGRAAQGVKVINLKGKDSIASIAVVPKSEEEEEVEIVENIEGSEIIEQNSDTQDVATSEVNDDISK